MGMEKKKIGKDIRKYLDDFDSFSEDFNSEEFQKLLLKHKSTNKSTSCKSLVKPVKQKGSKQTRNKKWDVFKLVQDLLSDENTRKLISFKSYILGTPQDNDSLYICQILGIPPEDSNNSLISAFLEGMNKRILQYITLLNGILKMIPKFLEEKPSEIKQKKMWFIDIFGEEAKYYLPDWEKYKRKSYNKPDYEKNFYKVLLFLNGEPASKLGYSKIIKIKTSEDIRLDDGTHPKRIDYKHFYLRHGPQGQIRMLYAIHCLLNRRKIEEEFVQEKIKELIDIPERLYQAVLHNLYNTN